MAGGYLLDTNVISETRKARADSSVIAFLASSEPDALFLSVLTVAELWKGVASKRRTDTLTADRLSVWVETIETTFAGRILPINMAIARVWSELSAHRSLPVIDTLIAATASVHKLTLVTRNTADLQATGVPLIDPWHLSERPSAL